MAKNNYREDYLDTQVQIGEVIPIKNNPRNVYVIHTECMHGDADHYSKHKIVLNERLIGNSDPVQIIRYVCGFFKHLMYGTRQGYPEDYERLMREANVEFRRLFQWDLRDFLSDLIPGDATTLGEYRAQLEGFYVRYFDLLGNQHSVLIDGKNGE